MIPPPPDSASANLNSEVARRRPGAKTAVLLAVAALVLTLNLLGLFALAQENLILHPVLGLATAVFDLLLFWVVVPSFVLFRLARRGAKPLMLSLYTAGVLLLSLLLSAVPAFLMFLALSNIDYQRVEFEGERYYALKRGGGYRCTYYRPLTGGIFWQDASASYPPDSCEFAQAPQAATSSAKARELSPGAVSAESLLPTYLDSSSQDYGVVGQGDSYYAALPGAWEGERLVGGRITSAGAKGTELYSFFSAGDLLFACFGTMDGGDNFISLDGGATWSAFTPEGMDKPGSNGQTFLEGAEFKDGSYRVSFNYPAWEGLAEKLAVFTSSDGVNWQKQ